MDKSVAQKFTIVMSIFIAAFATVFVCGNIISGGITSDSYTQLLAKSGSTISYSDEFIDDNNNVNGAVSGSDIYDNENITIIHFIDDEEVEPVVTSAQNADIDEEYLYMTTVTTTGSLTQRSTTTAKVTTRKTTASSKLTSSTANKTTTTTSTSANTNRTTTSVSTSASTKSTTEPTATTSKPTSIASENNTAAPTTTAPSASVESSEPTE